MNRIIPTLTFIIVVLSSYSQNVPNGGFDSWQTEDFFVAEDWVSYGQTLRTEDAKIGNYAITLNNYKNSEGDFVSSSLYNVDWQGGGVDKFPYDGNPLSMVFYAKYDLAPGDSAELTSGFYEKGNWIGDATIKITGNSGNQYITYSVPIQWYTISKTPDSVYIGMTSISHGGNAEGTGYISIDDFRFENIGHRTVEINNYDFENWVNEGVVYPDGWVSLDLLAFNFWGGFLKNPSVVQTDQPFRGANSLTIQNFESWGAPDRGLCFTGTDDEDAWGPAFKVDKKYKYLQGYYKYTNGGGDSAEVSLNMFVNGNYLGDGRIRFGATTEEWKFFSIPVNYYLDVTPDSATIRLFSAIDGSTKSINTVFQIDELEFVDELSNTVGITETVSDDFILSPNPFSNIVTFKCEGGVYSIFNTQGQLVKNGSLNNGENSLQLSSLNSGLYYIKIKDYNDRQWQKKIIKQ
ncbi:MAG: hypothetical protein COA58_05565 [Bacteroidetes bacterium]|nr:MAG: hypothetical protein COA58_05565 [Bacteroidota bacterium]